MRFDFYCTLEIGSKKRSKSNSITPKESSLVLCLIFFIVGDHDRKSDILVFGQKMFFQLMPKHFSRLPLSVVRGLSVEILYWKQKLLAKREQFWQKWPFLLLLGLPVIFWLVSAFCRNLGFLFPLLVSTETLLVAHYFFNTCHSLRFMSFKEPNMPLLLGMPSGVRNCLGDVCQFTRQPLSFCSAALLQRKGFPIIRPFGRACSGYHHHCSLQREIQIQAS